MSASLHELADEYVVGLLSEEEAREVERRMVSDRELAAAVEAARERFMEIDLTEKPSPVSAGAWVAIAGRLDGENPKVVPLGNDRTRAAKGSPVAAYWKTVAQTGIAACLALAVGLGWMLSQPEPEVIAILIDGSGEPQAVVEAFADDHVTIMPLVRFDVPQGRTLQVWTKRDTPDAKPVSLGLMEEIRRLNLKGPDLPVPAPGQLYEITIEPEGGSPTELPTGPIVGKGFAKTAI